MKKRTDRIGEESINRQGLWMRIVRYENSKRVLVEFPDTGECKWTRYDSFVNGRVAMPEGDARAVVKDEPEENDAKARRAGCLMVMGAIAAWVAVLWLIFKTIFG